MQMKKLLIVILAVLLLLVGLFFWKGGHHALYLSDLWKDWLDADNADQSITLHLQMPDLRQIELTADTFWTEYADRKVFGLTASGVSAYLDRGILYLDTGRAYALPDVTGRVRELATGLLLYGRITKSGDTYQISMKTDGLDLMVSVTADTAVRAVTVDARLPDGTSVKASLTPKLPVPHPIPQSVADAQVRSAMEPPMPIQEPLDVLIPAFEGLVPLRGDLNLGVSCGILELSETVGLTVLDGKASIERNGVLLELALPEELKGLSPAAGALLLLRDGEFTRSGENAEFSVILPADSATALLEALVPQAKGLGITLDSSRLTLHICAGTLRTATMSAEGSVPFLFTTIPVTFSAELTVT